ncbi:MAG: 30S ribosomal protein S5 [Candidatus Dojkabacteria bacterium]|nr:MAG: 30S ribosomal protein S5 [Candidatus Dojkabacteria bacterium]
MDRNNNRQQNNNQRGNRRPPFGQGNRQQEEKLFSELVALRRVAKATAGAKRLRFSAVLVVGDKKGKVGIAMGKGADPQEAIQKAMKKANSKLFSVEMNQERKTVTHRVEAQYKSSNVLIKPAPIGTGVVAGGSIRKVLELAGIENVVAKRMGAANSLTNAYCTILALTKLKQVKRGSKSPKVSAE